MRIVKVNLGGWDYHNGVYLKKPANANKLDSGLSSLLAHLSQKGLLDSTLVVVSTEFGRKPEVNPNKGRDHHPDGFTCLMAGAGVKAGQTYELIPALRRTRQVVAPLDWPTKAKRARNCLADTEWGKRDKDPPQDRPQRIRAQSSHCHHLVLAE